MSGALAKLEQSGRETAQALVHLDRSERDRLTSLEAVIAHGLAAFVEVGLALQEVRDRRLYREAHATFEDYCRQRWQLSRIHGHRLIEAAGVVTDLLPIGNTPTCESQARELVPLEPDQRRQVWAEVTAPGRPPPTAERVRELVQQVRRQVAVEKAGEVPAGKYQCVVIDPPWPMEKSVRVVRPNETRDLDYPTLPVERIGEIVGDVLRGHAHEAGCHVYLWTTHRFHPEALALFALWGVRYECQLTWFKPVGFTPFSWMYNTEHVLFGRLGSLPLTRVGLKLGFEAPVGRHSEKPDAFYELVRQASPEKRLDLFARGTREGFESWGAEAQGEVAAPDPVAASA